MKLMLARLPSSEPSFKVESQRLFGRALLQDFVESKALFPGGTQPNDSGT